jgi:DNA-binding transcriptional LysR family regulator
MHLEAGQLEIGTEDSIAVGLLPDVIHAWRRRFPDRFVGLHEFPHRKLVEDSVRECATDIGIGPPPLDWSGAVCRLGWEELVVVVAPDDPLAGRERTALSALADREWVLFSPDNGLSDLMRAAFASTPDPELEPRRAMLTSHADTAARMAARGVGPTMVPYHTIPQGLDGAIMRLDPPLGRAITAYTRFEWSPLAEAFVELLRETRWEQAPPDAVILD